MKTFFCWFEGEENHVAMKSTSASAAAELFAESMGDVHDLAAGGQYTVYVREGNAIAVFGVSFVEMNGTGYISAGILDPGEEDDE